MAFGPADRDGTNQNKDRTWKGPSVKLWVTAPAATFPLSPVHQTGITIINVKFVYRLLAFRLPLYEQSGSVLSLPPIRCRDRKASCLSAA